MYGSGIVLLVDILINQEDCKYVKILLQTPPGPLKLFTINSRECYKINWRNPLTVYYMNIRVLNKDIDNIYQIKA